jgi:hypothetical protein
MTDAQVKQARQNFKINITRALEANISPVLLIELVRVFEDNVCHAYTKRGSIDVFENVEILRGAIKGMSLWNNPELKRYIEIIDIVPKCTDVSTRLALYHILRVLPICSIAFAQYFSNTMKTTGTVSDMWYDKSYVNVFTDIHLPMWKLDALRDDYPLDPTGHMGYNDAVIKLYAKMAAWVEKYTYNHIELVKREEN